FFQAEDGIRDRNVTGFRRVLFRSELTTDPGEIGADGTVQVRAHPDGAARAGGMLHDPGAVVRVLCSHPMVTGARLRAVPDERSGARTVAEVALRGSTGHDAAPTGEELRALVRDRLGAASVPYEVLLSGPGDDGTGPAQLSSPGR